MSLTSRWLIAISGLLAVLAVVGTVWMWRRGGRLRIPIRITGLLAIEILVILTVALTVNRSEKFYPSWDSFGDLGSDQPGVTGPAPVGRLDRKLTAGAAIDWSPPEAAAWRLAGPATLVVPTGYGRHDGHSFPVVVTLTSADQADAVRRTATTSADVLTVVAVPTPDTTAAALATLPARLAQDTRAAGTGWAIFADPTHTTLARQWRDLVPTRFRAITASYESAVDRLPSPLTPPIKLPS